MSIYTHTTVGTNDRAKSKAFYEPTLGALGVDYIGELGEAGSLAGSVASASDLLCAIVPKLRPKIAFIHIDAPPSARPPTRPYLDHIALTFRTG